MRTTHLNVWQNFNTLWLQANFGASLSRIGHSASPWVSKGCGNMWQSPTILAASTRTSNCLSGSQPWQSRCDCPRDREAAFTIMLDIEDANRSVFQNLGRAIVKKLTIIISSNEVMLIDDSGVFHFYNDLWKTAPERTNSHYQTFVDNMRADGMWKNSFHLGSAWRPLQGVLSKHRGHVPNRTAYKDISAMSLDLDGPRGLSS